MSMLFAYMAGGEGAGARDFKMVCQSGVRFFSTCFVCVGGVRFNTSPSVKKK